MSKVREIPWPEEFQDLKRIEESMICGICYEYLNTSVMTPCSHSYCSLCIRKYLHYKTQCPACFHDVFEKDLYPNRTMDNTIRHYLQVREKILGLIENRKVYNSVKLLEQEQPSTPPVRPIRNSQFSKSPKKTVEISEVAEIQLNQVKAVDNVNSSIPSTSKLSLSSPITSKSPKVQIPSIAKIFTTPKRKETSVPIVIDASSKTVPCPVCSVNISEQHINVHLDACLRRETNPEPVVKKQPKRPPLPKLVLHVMKETELRKKIKEFGLSTIGDRRALINRFTRYSVIYNAECDKDNPRSTAELIRQCEMEEKQERKMDCFLVAKNTEAPRLQIERNAKEEEIDEAQKNYRVANKSSFDKLIEEVRNRRKLEKEAKSGGTELNDEASASGKSSTSPNTLDGDDTAYFPVTDKAFQDSDSEFECPLQHYTSENAGKKVGANYEDSSSCASGQASPVKKLQKGRNRSSTRTRKSATHKVETKNVYEIETDNSADEVICSPVVKKKTNLKRVKLLDKFSNTSLKAPISTTVDQVVVDINDDDFVDELDIREAAAKKVCNSILKDFSCESDESANELVDKIDKSLDKKVKNAQKMIADNVKKIADSTLNRIKQQKKTKVKSHKEITNVPANDRDDISLIHVPPEIFSDDDLLGFTNLTAVNKMKNSQEKNVTEKGEIASEKENIAVKANDTNQNSVSEVSRPVRKRNVLVRYSEKSPTSKTTRAETLTNGSSDSVELDDEYTDGSVTVEGGSLKRRRGKPKMPYVDPLLEMVQNPPKRPVRRRQVTPDAPSC